MSQLTQAGLPSHASLLVRRVIALAALLALALPMSVSSADLVGQPAPDFALRSMSGAAVRLSEHLGEVVVINFWATWCGPCRQEMPLLDEIYGKYRRVGLVLLSVNIDEDAQPADEMARTLRVSYPVLFDARKEVSRAYQVNALPVTVLVDRAGIVRYVSEGYKPGYEKRYTVVDWRRCLDRGRDLGDLLLRARAARSQLQASLRTLRLAQAGHCARP